LLFLIENPVVAGMRTSGNVRRPGSLFPPNSRFYLLFAMFSTIAILCAAIVGASATFNVTAVDKGSPSPPTPTPLPGLVHYLTPLESSSPCGGDIAIPAATNNLVTVFACDNREDYNIQLTLTSNTGGSAWGLYIAWGEACRSNNPPPGSFFPEVSTVATAANPNPFLTGFCDTELCCGAYSCRAPPCSAATVSVDYTAPSSAPCSMNNERITNFALSTAQTFGQGCINVANNYKIVFTLSNPLPETISVFTASGANNCGIQRNFDLLLPTNGGVLPEGFTPSASVTVSNSNSFVLSSSCTDEPCCAIVW